MKKAHYIFLLLALLLLVGCNEPESLSNNTLYHEAFDDETLMGESSDDKNKAFLHYYGIGMSYVQAGLYIEAILYLIEAENLSEDFDDNYILGQLYMQMGSIYKDYYDYSKSLDKYQKAAACYERAGKDLHRLYALLEQAGVCKDLGMFEDSYQLLHSVLKERSQSGYHRITELCMSQLVMLCVDMKRYDEADLLFHKFQQNYVLSAMSSTFFSNVAEIYAVKKEWNLSHEMLKRAWSRAETSNDTIILHFAEARLYEMEYPQTEAYRSMLEGVKKQSLLMSKNMERPLLTAQRDYLSEKLEYKAYKLRMEKQLRVLYILLFTMLLSLVAWVSYRKLKKKKTVIDKLGKERDRVENENKRLLRQLEDSKKEADRAIERLKNEVVRKEKGRNEEISDLIHKLEQGENAIETLKQALELKEESRLRMELLVQKLEDDSRLNSDIIDTLHAELERQEVEYRQNFDRMAGMFRESVLAMGEIMLDFEKIKAPNTFVENAVKQWKKNFFVGNKAVKNLERLVNEFYGDVMVHFRREVCLQNQEDYRQACYLFAGVSIKVIAWLMGKNENGIYKWRLRLREKIESSDLEHRNLFLNLFAK